MWSVRPLLFVLVLLSVTFAGCLGGEPDTAPAPDLVAPDECIGDGLCGANAVVDETGRDLRTHLLATDTLDAPTWVIGDVFEQHLYYGNADTQGEHIVTMVVDDSGSCYQFGTTSKVAARFEAVFDLPILGCIGKQSLQTSGFEADWGWMYQFPLEDGKSWEGSIDFLFNWNDNAFYAYDFTLTATFAEKIDTPKGDFPGFEITGVTPEGETFLSYNYVPAVGWFSHFWMYDLATDDADDVIFHAMNMGRSSGYTGPYYIDESEEAIEGFFMPVFSSLAGETPQATFTMSADATYLKGVIVPFACAGVSRVTLVTPGNQAQDFEHQGTDPTACQGMTQDSEAPDPRMYTVHFYDGPAEAGDWKVLPVGTGVFGYYIMLEAVTEVEYQLAAPEVSDASEAV